MRDRGVALALVLGVMLNLSGAVLCYTLSKMCRFERLRLAQLKRWKGKT